MLARTRTSLECSKYWNLLLYTHFKNICTHQHYHSKYIHTAAKVKTKPQQSASPTKITSKPISQKKRPSPSLVINPSILNEEDSVSSTTPSSSSSSPSSPSSSVSSSSSSLSSPPSSSSLPYPSPTTPPSSLSAPESSKVSQPLSVEDFEDEDGIIRYRPSPSVPPKRVPFNVFLARAKANKVSIVDIPADTPRKEFFEILKYLPGKTSLRDLTIRVKELNVAQAALLAKILQTCENLQSFRIFSIDFYGPAGVQALHILTKGILNSENLDNLSLEGCKISTPGWEVIAEWLHKTTKLKSVDLKRTRMTGAHAHKLVASIKTNQNASFESLDWDQNMTNDVIVALVLKELASVEAIKNVFIKNYKVYRHNWNHTLLQVEAKNEEKKDQVRSEIEKHRDALKEEFVPKPMSTFHSNENEYINPRDKDRLQRKEKESKIMQAYEEFDYLKGATDREVLKKIQLLKKRTQSKRGAVVKLK